MVHLDPEHVKDNVITIAIVVGFFGLIAAVSYFQWA